ITQTTTCDGCRSFTQRGHLGFNARVCVVRRLARWLGLGRWMGARLGWRMGARLESWLGPGLAGPWLGMGPSLGLGLGRTALRCGARILRRGMRRSTSGPRPVGSALDFSESVLVTDTDGYRFER